MVRSIRRMRKQFSLFESRELSSMQGEFIAASPAELYSPVVHTAQQQGSGMFRFDLGRVAIERQHAWRWLLAFVMTLATSACSEAADRPNLVFVMADDLGYAQTGYYDHPLLDTPHLDRLAAGGLRLDRFYAGSAVCSPTRASVLTGRHPARCGVPSHGHALRRQESTMMESLQAAGYATGHFGKWHLDGLRGPGAPIFEDDRFHPGHFGFDTWLSVTNFFDRNPLMSRLGRFESFQGDSSEVTVDQALQFMGQQSESGTPFATVIWFGTPHSPFVAAESDVASLASGSEARRQILDSMDQQSRQHYGELVAMDRSLGALRAGLEKLSVLENTLIWFCSDNGGLPKIKPSTTAPLRGNKGTLYEGGVRVPCVLHWPSTIAAGRVSAFPAVTSDIAPTVLDLLSLESQLVQPVDGISLASLIVGNEVPETRSSPIGFQHLGSSSVIDGDWKLLRPKTNKRSETAETAALYDLRNDLAETTNVIDRHPNVARRLGQWLDAWNESVARSVAGQDYPSKSVDPDHPEPMFWTDSPRYQAIFDQLRDRPEYANWIKKKEKSEAVR